MKTASRIVLFATLLFSQSVLALPPLWETAFNMIELNGTNGGAVLNGAPSGGVDAAENIGLGFNFPFGGVTYNRISVDSDGAIVLKNDNSITNIPNSTWTRNNFQSDFSNLGDGSVLPVILGFNSALSQLLTGGKVWYAAYNSDFKGLYTGPRGIITWEGSSLQTLGSADITFQVVLLGNGTIIFNYLALTDPATIWNAKSEAGIVIGVSNGDGTWPAGSQNLNASDFGIDLIGYQIWCKNDDPLDPSTCMQAVLGRNGDFDLHDKSVVFNPDGTSGFLVSSTIKSGAGAGGSGVCAVLGDPAGGGAVAGASGGGGGGGISVTALLFMMFLPFVLPPRRSDRKTA